MSDVQKLTPENSQGKFLYCVLAKRKQNKSRKSESIESNLEHADKGKKCNQYLC